VSALLDIRSSPDVNGPRTHVVMQPGEVFMVSEEHEGPDGVLYLKLADGRGWVFDKKPGAGMMCVRHPGLSQPVPGMQPVAGAAGPPQLVSPMQSSRGVYAAPPLLQGMASEGGLAYCGTPNMSAPHSQVSSIRVPAGPVTAPVAAASQWLYSPDDMTELELRTAPDFQSPVTGQRLRPGDVFGVAEETHAEGAVFLRLADGRGWAPDSMPGKGILCVRAPMTLPSQAAPQPLPGVVPPRSGSVHIIQQPASVPVQVAAPVPVTISASPVPVQVTYTNRVAPTTLIEAPSIGAVSPLMPQPQALPQALTLGAATQCVGTPVSVTAMTQCVGAPQVLSASTNCLGGLQASTAAAPTMQFVQG